MKVKEQLMHCSKLKETRGIHGLSVTHGPKLNFLLQRISLGQLAEMRPVLWPRQHVIGSISGNSLMFIASRWLRRLTTG